MTTMKFIDLNQQIVIDDDADIVNVVYTQYEDMTLIRGACFEVPSSQPTNSDIFLHVLFGINIAAKLGFKEGNKIHISYNEENNRIFMLNKTEGNGRKLKKHGYTDVAFTMPWTLFIPEEKEAKRRQVKIIEIGNNSIIIDTSLEKVITAS